MTKQPHIPTSQLSRDANKKDANNMATPIIELKSTQPATANAPHPCFIDIKQRCLVTAEQLKRYSDPDELPSDTRTAPDLDVGFGQQRALKALQTALDIKASG